MLKLPDTLKHYWVETKKVQYQYKLLMQRESQKKLMSWGERSTILFTLKIWVYIKNGAKLGTH